MGDYRQLLKLQDGKAENEREPCNRLITAPPRRKARNSEIEGSLFVDEIDIPELLKLYPSYNKVLGPYIRKDNRRIIVLTMMALLPLL